MFVPSEDQELYEKSDQIVDVTANDICELQLTTHKNRSLAATTRTKQQQTVPASPCQVSH